MKAKIIGKNDANTKTTQRYVIEEETEVLGVKPLCCSPSGNRSTRQSVRIHELARDPPSLIYPLYLSPSSSYSNKVVSLELDSKGVEIVMLFVISVLERRSEACLA